jgi:thioesterase-3
MQNSAQPHYTDIKVRGYHLDLYGHVNNARYLEFLEEARWGFTDTHGSLEYFTQAGIAFVIVNVNINYRRAALMGEALRIETAMKKIGSRSAVIHQVVKLKNTDTVVADADVTFVIFDTKRGSAVSMDGELRALFERLPAWPSKQKAENGATH